MKRIARQLNVGFTLVELLVVIGIIAVLISVLLPVLSRAREAANATQCMSNLHQFAVADQMYVNQYNWHMPGWWNDSGNTAAFNAYGRYWAGITDFRKALGMPVLYPLSVGYFDPGGSDPLVTKPGYRCYVTRQWYCPDAPRAFAAAPDGGDPQTHQSYYPIHYSYGMNVMGVDTQEYAGNPGVVDPRATQAINADPLKIFHGFKPSQVKRPADKIHFADAMYFVINTYGVAHSTGAFRGYKGAESNYDLVGERTNSGTLPSGTAYNSQRSIAWRHRGGANVVFFDGHGEWVRKDLLYTKDASGNLMRRDAIWDVMN